MDTTLPEGAETIFCTRCGEKNPENNFRCTRCKEPLHDAPRVAAVVAGPTDDAAMRMLLPVGRSGWAIAAGYLGLFAVLLLPAPFALAAGLMAVRDIRANPAKLGMGRAVFGIVMGALGSLVLLAIAVK
jgi:hypothetical protein